MALRIDFTPQDVLEVKAQRVYWKPTWQEAWVQIENLWCSEAVWTCAPTIPSATVHWRYGIALDPGTAQWLARARQEQKFRWFVKIEIDPHTKTDPAETPLRWFGTLEIDADAVGGILTRTLSGDNQATPRRDGEQLFTCYGLEALLDLSWIYSSAVRDPAGGIYTVKRGLTFNERPEPPTGSGSLMTGNCHLDAGSDDFAVFHHGKTGGVDWTTFLAVQYLLRQHVPREADGTRKLEFVCFDADQQLPTWDRPTLPTHGKTLRQLLNALIPSQRLLSWHLVPQENSSPADDDSLVGEPIELVPFTFASDDIDLSGAITGNPPWLGSATIKANPSQVELHYQQDRCTQARLLRSAGEQWDRVRVIGARRTSTATFSHADLTLERGWTIDLSVEYDDGASGATDYPHEQNVELRQWRNQEARNQEKFRSVYARFVIPDGTDGTFTFDYLVGDGVSGVPDQPLTPDKEIGGSVTAADVNPVKLAPEDLRFLPYLLLKTGYDYSGTHVAQGTLVETAEGVEHERMRPLVIFPRTIETSDGQPPPESSSEDKPYRLAEKAGLAATSETAALEMRDTWSARVSVSHEDGALWLNVTNDDQHVIAKTDFIPFDIDYPAAADWRDMLATLSVAWSDHVEVVYPDNLNPGDTGGDHVREWILDVGEAFRLDWLCPKTVVGLEPTTGKPLRADEGGFLQDDRPRMQALARVAHAWYSAVHRLLQLTTTRISTALAVGDFVTKAGDLQNDLADDVQSVITSMRFASPKVEAEGANDPPPPQLIYVTDFGQFDPLSFL